MIRIVMLIVVGICYSLAIFVQAGIAYFVSTEHEAFWPTASPENYAVLSVLSIGAMAMLGAGLVLATYVKSIWATVAAASYCFVGLVIGDPWVPYDFVLLPGLFLSVYLVWRINNDPTNVARRGPALARSRD